jgi:hypothetical protein
MSVDSKYSVGDIIHCQGIKGVVVYPRVKRKVTVAWQGFDDLDDYSFEWLEDKCGYKKHRGSGLQIS